MGKIAEQIEDQRNDVTAGSAERMIEDRGAVVMDHDDQAPELVTLTAADQTRYIVDAMQVLALGFITETDITRSGPDGTEVERINQLGFQQTQLLGTIVWKVETFVADAQKRVDEQRLKIRRAVNSANPPEEAVMSRMADYLEALILRQAYCANALKAAKEAYEVVVGRAYGERAPSRSSAPKSALEERLAALGLG